MDRDYCTESETLSARVKETGRRSSHFDPWKSPKGSGAASKPDVETPLITRKGKVSGSAPPFPVTCPPGPSTPVRRNHEFTTSSPVFDIFCGPLKPIVLPEERRSRFNIALFVSTNKCFGDEDGTFHCVLLLPSPCGQGRASFHSLLVLPLRQLVKCYDFFSFFPFQVLIAFELGAVNRGYGRP